MMVKRFGQSLALIAMMASVVNAQCAASCSLYTIAATLVDQTSHSCCPRQDEPKPEQHKDQVPCPHPAPASAEARINNSIASFNPIPAAIVASLGHEIRPQLPETFLSRPAASNSSGSISLSLIFILRI